LAFTPHTPAFGFTALIGAETSDPPEPDWPFVLPLPCWVGAQVFVCPLPPATLALTPQTVALGLPALTGAETRLPPVEPWPFPPLEAELELPCVDGAHPFVWLLPPRTLAFTPQTVTFASPPLTGAETSEPLSEEPLPFPL
jgi:hypothetical protein